MLRKRISCQKLKAGAYSSPPTYKSLNKCFICFVNGRHYSQGHASASQRVEADLPITPTNAEAPAPSVTNTDPDPSLVQQSETKSQIKVLLGATTELLSSTQAKKEAECRRRLLKNGHIWNTAVQAFDVRYQKGCITNRSKLLELPSIKKVEAPVVKHNNKTQSGFKVFSASSLSTAKPISTDSDMKELSTEYDHFHLQKINQFTRQMSSFVSMLLAETGKPEVIRDFLHMFLINGDCTIKWLANKKIVDSRLPNILMKAYAEKACMADCLKFHQLLIKGSVTMNIETYIWMLLAALRSESPQSNTNMVLRKIEDVNLTHLLPIGLSSNLMTPYRDLMKEVMQGVEQYRPDLQLEQLTTSRMATNCDEEYINSVARGFNVPYESPNPHLGVISEQDAVSLVEKQMHLETQGDIPIESISVVKFSEKTFQARKSYKEMMEHWRTSLAQNFQSVLERAEFDKDANIINWIQVYMECMPAETLVNIMLEESARMCEMSLYYSHYYGFICQKLGELVRKCYLGYKNQTLTSKIKDVQMEYINNFYNNATHSTSYRQQFLQADSDNLLDQCVMDRWPPSIIHAVGELLLDIILKSTKVPVELLSNGNTDEPIPAFYIVNRHFKTHVVKQFKPHPSIKKLLDLAQLNTLHLNITELPVFTPPVPSLDDGKGILFQTRTRLVKASREDYFGPGEVREMLPVLDALNILSAVPWRVNTNISPLVIKVFNDGGDAATKIPLASEHASLTEEECGDLEPKQIDSKLKKIKNELISDRASFLLALSIANYCGDDLFWLPSNLDFRGRAYPLSAHFSHVSSDPRRAMLKFAKGKRLGKEGLEWLKIHLVNMTGHKKQASNSERLAYAEELMANAFESADNPLEGEQWWRELDEPWQGLAACMELRAAMSCDNPEDYVSHLPIHQDGSCNGLQHYSALGRDQSGAMAVNVLPSDTPRDVYSEVAALVEQWRAADAAKGNETAKLLEGQITRKVVKQTVMTTVYGVTRFGAQAQIKSHLADQYPNLTASQLKLCSHYISETLFKTLGNMFTSGTEIQNWLTLVAHHVTSVANKPVTWKTPLGLQVTQNYWRKATPVSMRQAKRNKDLTADDKLHGARHDTELEQPDVSRNMNGFPPNFIHSLDATHMMLTALHCQRQGITFASIHDCYWTHACDIKSLNKVCRQAFCDMYNEPILEQLSQYLLDKYVDPDNPSHARLTSVIKSVPRQGTLDIEKVKESEYFFS